MRPAISMVLTDPPPPMPWSGYRTFWDPGLSILSLRERFRSLFYPVDWLDRAAFAKQTEYGTWRQVRIGPILPGQPFEDQAAKVPKGDTLPSARTLVALLVIHLLATGERLDTPRLRSGTVIAGIFLQDVLNGRTATAASFWPDEEMREHLPNLTKMMVVYNFGFLLLNETMIRAVDPSHWLLFWAVLPIIGHTVLRAMVLTVINLDDGHKA